MTASVNGWRVIARQECHDVQVPGGILPVHPEFAWLAWDCANLWHETVEPLQWPGCWGWAPPRPIRGSDDAAVVTNHGSGTAWDLCAPRHPRGVPIARTFTPAQLAAVERMEARYFGVLRWGGRWRGADVDGMHWEGIPGVTVDAVQDLTDLLQGRRNTPPPAPLPVPLPQPPPPVPTSSHQAPTGWTGPDLVGATLGLRGHHGNNGRRVEVLQGWLRRTYPAYRHDLDGQLIVPDGWWGDQTTAWLRLFAYRSAIRFADGRNIGPRVARRLYLSGLRL